MSANPIPVATPLFVASIAKGFRVLECVALAGKPLTISEISNRTGFDRSLVQRVPNTLHTLGYLTRDGCDRRYDLAITLLDFSYRFLCREPLLNVAVPQLVALSEETESRVAWCVLDGTDMIFLYRVPRKFRCQPPAHVGERQPAYATASGRAVLAHLPESEARTILDESVRSSMTPFTRTEVDEFISEFAEIRSKGYAIQHQEVIVGETAIAAPVRDDTDKPVAAVACAAVHSCDSARIEQLAIALLKSVAKISRAFRSPE